ncbi:MAG: hypothetical protein Q9181_002849 [Wetmoreana brouardii]
MAYSAASSPHLSNVPDLTHYPYYETSTESSPSPRIVPFNNFDAMPRSAYSPMSETQWLLQHRQHQQQQQAAILFGVEFTDLTAPVHEDRRRRKSTTLQDKQAISNMRIRRRAQNRASQRAFRERKEKHVQHLEHELEALEAKHRDLQKSHSELGETKSKLQAEVEQLRNEIKTLRVSGDGSARGAGAGGSTTPPNAFDAFGGDDDMFDPVNDFPF